MELIIRDARAHPTDARIPQLERERVPMSRSVRAGGIDQPAAVAASTWGALSRT
jgi:hypothetical protein